MQRKLWEGNISDIQKEIFHCLEKGDIFGANVRLNDMVQSVKSMTEIGKEGVKNTIDCYKQKIYILEMQEENEQNIKEIKKCYDTIYELGKSEQYACEFILQYGNFLMEQNDPSAEVIYKKLEWIYLDPDKKVSDEEYFNLYLNFANFKCLQGRTENVEKYYLDCLELLNKIEKEHFVNKKRNKAIVLLNLGNFYHQKNKWNEAEEKYQEFFEISAPQMKFYESYDENYVQDIANAYRVLAVLEMQKKSENIGNAI